MAQWLGTSATLAEELGLFSSQTYIAAHNHLLLQFQVFMTQARIEKATFHAGKQSYIWGLSFCYAKVMTEMMTYLSGYKIKSPNHHNYQHYQQQPTFYTPRVPYPSKMLPQS